MLCSATGDSPESDVIAAFAAKDAAFQNLGRSVELPIRFGDLPPCDVRVSYDPVLETREVPTEDPRGAQDPSA